MRSIHFAALLSLAALCGCASTGDESFAFLGVPENESSKEGPVGLIGGSACRVDNVTQVMEARYEDYEDAKREGQVFAEERRGGYVYYAVKMQRDVHFDNASAMVEVLERWKAKEP